MGVAFENLSEADVLERMARAVATRTPTRIEVATAGTLVQTRRDAALQQRLAEADLVVCDSTLLVWSSHWLGNPLRERIPSARLLHTLAREAAQRGWRLFVLGSRPEAVAAICASLARDHGLPVAGSYAGPDGDLFDELEAAREILLAKPDVLVVLSSSPNSEAWAAAHFRRLGVPACLHLRIRPDDLHPQRASRWRSWRERIRNAVTVTRCVWRQRRGLATSAVNAPPPILRHGDEWVDIEGGISLTRSVFDQQPDTWRTDGRRTSHWTLDASRVREIDATGLALLARLRAACQRAGRHFILVAPTEPVRRALRDAGWLERFEITATLRDARRLVPNSGPTVLRGVTRSLAWCGEIIAANVDDVWQMTSDYVRTFTANGATLVVIDLARLRFIDSAGATLMVRVKRWCREIQAQVVFAHPQPNVRKVLRLTAADLVVLEGAQ